MILSAIVIQVPPLPLEDRPAGDSGPAETAATSAIPPTGAATTDAAGPSAERRPNSDTEPDHSIDTASMNATTKRSIFRLVTTQLNLSPVSFVIEFWPKENKKR